MANQNMTLIEQSNFETELLELEYNMEFIKSFDKWIAPVLTFGMFSGLFGMLFVLSLLITKG